MRPYSPLRDLFWRGFRVCFLWLPIGWSTHYWPFSLIADSASWFASFVKQAITIYEYYAGLGL